MVTVKKSGRDINSGDINPYASSVVKSSEAKSFGTGHRRGWQQAWDEGALLIGAFAGGASLYCCFAVTMGYFRRGLLTATAVGLTATVLLWVLRHRQRRHALGQQPLLANGQSRMARGIENEVREQVKAKYAQAYQEARWPRRWILSWRMAKEVRLRVAESRAGVSKTSLF